ncbi:lipoprotein-releasing ABC transporter permease subunit [Salinimonas marina]|uniref:Lipoprotein-releasing ABC transporter permease subunit n=1 Tax=Salinimonas marina TaxID=2785918 RepID=A0A7S9DV07_9ALTE|nr:lipoprotein-releasing ABC transporter permease subunit [Salinimonas marina]QPG04482.1 lipoprotein-releasing ABC transporter permease subunit [Salinimonas marina]
MKLAWQLARRFRQAKQQNRYISFISFSSTFGIGLGCFVLITLLSVMNGFERELTHRILAVIPHGELYSVSNEGINNWPAVMTELERDERLVSVEPYTKITGMLQHKGALKPVELTGLAVASVDYSQWRQQVTPQAWERFRQSHNTVLLGQGLIEKFGLEVGDNLGVLVPVTSDDMVFKAPQRIKLTLAGSLSIGGELDNYLGLMHLGKASQAANIDSGAQGLRFRLHDPYQAKTVMRDIGYRFPQAVYMSDWTRTQGHLYNDIQLVRTVVYIVLTLVIAVACFNIVSTLVMAVREKRAAIAILKTMGAQDSLIRQAFILQGLTNGIIGIVAGTVLAVITAPNLASIVKTIEGVFNTEILSGDIYFINFLPSQLQVMDVVLTVVVAVILVVLATLYPASQAVKVAPASALNG